MLFGRELNLGFFHFLNMKNAIKYILLTFSFMDFKRAWLFELSSCNPLWLMVDFFLVLKTSGTRVSLEGKMCTSQGKKNSRVNIHKNINNF